jgi:hypothetical protein
VPDAVALSIAMPAGSPAEIIRGMRTSKITSLDCTGCSECCNGGVVLQGRERRQFRYYSEQYANQPPTIRCRSDGSCVFLTGEGKCNAYEKRPRACKESDCRVLALRSLALERMGVKPRRTGPIRLGGWKFSFDTPEDHAVILTFERLFKTYPMKIDAYPIDLVRSGYWREMYDAVLDDLRQE